MSSRDIPRGKPRVAVSIVFIIRAIQLLLGMTVATTLTTTMVHIYPMFRDLDSAAMARVKDDPGATGFTADECLSPEKNVSWILDGSCLDNPITSSSSRSSSRNRSCGPCGGGAAYLRTLRDEIEAEYKEKCQELVVYGAAMGPKYSAWVRDPNFFDPNGRRSVDRYGTCMFTFVTGIGTAMDYSVDKSQVLIHVDASMLPYENDRRNVKLLKLNPGLLFPWAKRVIWQDTKLLRRANSYDMPVDYVGHFRSAVEQFDVCSSFMGLPPHPWAISDSSSVSLMAHCDTIIKAARKRPTVSDSLDVLSSQCHLYYDANRKDDREGQVFRQQPLIDSAFMLWDMRSESCRLYNGNLLCSWLDEIHCYTDRDQVSFSSVLSSSGVHLVSSEGESKGSTPLDRVYANQDHTPMVHIANPACHWYYHHYSHCIG